MEMQETLTRLRDADSHRAPLESRPRHVESFLQPINRFEFNIAESLGGFCQLILHNPDICHSAAGEKIADVARSRVEGQVPNMRSIRRLGWERERLPYRESATVTIFFTSD